MADLLDDPLLAAVPVEGGLKRLEDCELTERLGAGGMGAVYRGRHRNLQIDVAVKCLLPHSAGDESIQRFQREARVAAAINHPNLVRVYDIRHAHGLHYIVMEFIDGLSLHQHVRQHGPMQPREACAVILEAARGLAAAHAQGIVHRDIKPGNIMLLTSGATKVVDLGLAKSTDETEALLTHSQAVMGTPQYMPPEQYDGAAAVRAPGDVYALGATLAFLLTGRDPFHGLSSSQIMKTLFRQGFPGREAGLDTLPDVLQATIARATATDAAHRHADAGALVEDLEACLAELAAEPHPVSAGAVSAPREPIAPPAVEPLMTHAQLPRPISKVALKTKRPRAMRPGEAPARLATRGKLLAAGGTLAATVLLMKVTGLVGSGSTGTGPDHDGWRTPQPLGTLAEATSARAHSWTSTDPAPAIEGFRYTGDNAAGLPRYAYPLAADASMDFVLLPAGTLTMGSPEDEPGRGFDEGPQLSVAISAFLMAEKECTQAQWRAVMGGNPSAFLLAGDDAPVEQVSWSDLQAFEARTQLTLPSEAQWEYACRAGSADALPSGPLTLLGDRNGPELAPLAWYGGNSGVSYAGGEQTSHWVEKQFDHSRAGTHPTARLRANAFGLYDMLGNVWEWCEDDWHNSYVGAPRDGSAWRDGDSSAHVIRGGSWSSQAGECRCASRSPRSAGASGNTIGFRLAKLLP